MLVKRAKNQSKASQKSNQKNRGKRSRLGSLDLDQRPSGYNPHLGFVGDHQIQVSNYLFSEGQRHPKTYQHTKSLVQRLLGRPVTENLKASQNLTQFLRQRDLTFQKLDQDGFYRLFTVPVTTTVVPLPKSVFNEIEKAAQTLILGLRKVLQDIYGAPSLTESAFVQSLDSKDREIFIRSAQTSPHYFPQLHHPHMKSYPFFDNVGLDLVMVEALSKTKENPFRILELNAGSPSGASNNANIIEGLFREDPQVLGAFDRILPNDHFQVLGETYQSLGASWTGVSDGVQVVLPPGGANGATPEIQQLAAYSGLIYCDPGQLYLDNHKWIRLRTASGQDPKVTAIYSRVNADSILFNPERGIYLRDQDTGEPVYCTDPLKPWENGKPLPLLSEWGNPVPLESDYAIPGALDAVLEKRIYIGGLNRLLDNKMILSILTEHAPQYFSKEIKNLGVKKSIYKIEPPECLASEAASIKEIERAPEDWVIKAPNLSGGNGVHILMTMSPKHRKQVIESAKKNPDQFAYQRMVKIARIPVAVSERKNHARYANLAADMRVWVFCGAEGMLPRMTHNALVRFAPEEKGPMSSIVNTSKGGGYAPFVVVDDIGDPRSVDAKTFAQPPRPSPLTTAMPAFVGAQLVQCARILQKLRFEIRSGKAHYLGVYGHLIALKLQTREMTAFVHPRCMDVLYAAIEAVEKKIDHVRVAEYFLKYETRLAVFTGMMKDLISVLNPEFLMAVDGLHVLNQDQVGRGYGFECRREDEFTLGHLLYRLRFLKDQNPVHRRQLTRFGALIKAMVQEDVGLGELDPETRGRVEVALDRYQDLASQRIEKVSAAGGMSHHQHFSRMISGQDVLGDLKHIEMIPACATEWESKSQKLLTDSEFVGSEIKKIRKEWVERSVRFRSRKDLKQCQEKHFEKHPKLKGLQQTVDLTENNDPQKILQLLDILPYAAYNLRLFATSIGLNTDQVFSDQLTHDRIAILDREQRRHLGLPTEGIAGECFARKRQAHGLISNADRLIWVAKENSPFVQLYTIGHELIHMMQMREIMNNEIEAREKGALDFAQFLNAYGNFLALASNTQEQQQGEVARVRKPLIGLSDRIVTQFYAQPIKDIRHALKKDTESYHRVLGQYGSLWGYMMPVSGPCRVRALKEVIPALENAKNIIFAKECGLRLPVDEIQAALPTANLKQRQIYEDLIRQQAKSWRLEAESLRIIASHQYYGVRFVRKSTVAETMGAEIELGPITLNTSYNQSQQ